LTGSYWPGITTEEVHLPGTRVGLKRILGNGDHFPRKTEKNFDIGWISGEDFPLKNGDFIKNVIINSNSFLLMNGGGFERNWTGGITSRLKRKTKFVAPSPDVRERLPKNPEEKIEGSTKKNDSFLLPLFCLPKFITSPQ